MKQFKIFAAAAAAMLCSTAALSVSAEEAVMTFRMDADKTAIPVSELEETDAVAKGAVYIDNYTGLTSLRLILKSDSPLVIENGAFTADPEKKDKDGNPVHLLFAEHDQAEYMQYSEITGASNVVLWYAKDYVHDKTATVTDAKSSFVNFDIRIPKGTKPGDYKCYISTEVLTNEANQKEEDFFAYGGADQLELDKDVKLTPVDIAVYLLGDTNLDGVIGIEDAQMTLKAYTDGIAGKASTLTPAQINSADVTGNKEVGVDDAQYILKYYTEKYVAAKDTTWEKLLGKQ